jgi:hypothetical protein
MFALVFLISAAEPEEQGLQAAIAHEREAVEQLAAEVDAARVAARAELLGLEARERDLEAQLSSATLKRDALLAELERQRAELGHAGVGAAADDEAVAQGIQQARDLIAATVPVDEQPRRARLDRVASVLAAQGAAAAAPLLWEHLDAELALAAVVGRGRQPVRVGDKRIMADTLHVGLALMFFRTGGGTMGYAKHDAEGGWQFVAVDDATARVRLAELFDAARHGPPRGTFLLPNPLANSRPNAVGGKP